MGHSDVDVKRLSLIDVSFEDDRLIDTAACFVSPLFSGLFCLYSFSSVYLAFSNDLLAFLLLLASHLDVPSCIADRSVVREVFVFTVLVPLPLCNGKDAILITSELFILRKLHC